MKGTGETWLIIISTSPMSWIQSSRDRGDLLPTDRWMFSEERKWASPHLITPRIETLKLISVGAGFFKIPR